ncbi:ferritin-like domain-containing protein [Ketogulonicigenium vulgare]|uniref:ferritin-like domain-containing protein n=1 Tax=Ketogulonicigenium vulgare TaxID=92945 RepID=UPI0023584C90|nr:ferritin-like domain-containing protein [Ketogulonicigenium vulgare]
MPSIITARDVFSDGLRNAHAMEKQALSIMEPQLKRLEHYPEVSAMLDNHIRETKGQIARLDEILEGLDEGSSMLKDMSLSFAGTMAAVTHSMADDEILKNTMANFAFENFEIAAYTALITTAEEIGASAAIPLLKQNLQEEKRMATLIHEGMPAVVRRYLALSASDQRADI